MRCAVLLLILVLAVPLADAQPTFDTYAHGSWFLPQSPSVTGGSPGAFYNPAAWGTSERTDAAFYWSTLDVRPHSLDDWGFSVGHNVGFSTQTFTSGTGRFQDFQIGFAGGDRRGSIGASWHWLGGDRELAGRGNGLSLGLVSRPGRHVTVGYSVLFDGLVSPASGVVDVGVRPLGTPLVTLFGDMSGTRGRSLRDFPWGVGVEVRPVTGTHLGVTLRDHDTNDFTLELNLGMTLDNVALNVQPAYSEGGHHLHTTTLVHARPAHRGIPLTRTIREARGPILVVPISLEGKRISYQKPRYFDSETVMWTDLLAHLNAIRDEPLAAGVLLNLSGTSIRPSIAWELRQKLQEIRRSGKAVYVHGDRMRMGTYYVASAADRLVLDPRGSLLLPGLAAHRTYMKGLLEKIGIGSEELRYFTHKTAFQRFTRTDMSDADREQLGELVDSIYETWRDAIAVGRGIQPDAFDRVVDEDVYLSADLALTRNLVDGLGRWEDMTVWLEGAHGLTVSALPGDPQARPHPDEQWGEPAEIALVYLQGACDMDTGIRGRASSKYLRSLKRKSNLAGVVLRVDSPGGDPLASDLVAHEVRALRQRGVPVIVSQGDVAASGGYWLSMDADTVLTTPLTITGSIGVIAGWFWDEGFSSKTGLTADGVQRGKHADVFTGIRLPLVGGFVPGRALTDEERDLARDRIVEEYDDFVAMVAAGRGMPEARVRDLAEGRVWMGEAALEHRLVDGLGGLELALTMVRAKAGLSESDEVVVTEFPPRPLVREPRLGPDLPGLFSILTGGSDSPLVDEPREDYETIYTRILAGSPGRPMLLVPPAALPPDWTMFD